jgi:hypothetical protein
MRGWPCSGLDNVGRCWRYYFRTWKAICYLGPHSTIVEPLNTLKKGRLLSTSFAMNLFIVAIRSVNSCTSFFLFVEAASRGLLLFYRGWLRGPW